MILKRKSTKHFSFYDTQAEINQMRFLWLYILANCTQFVCRDPQFYANPVPCTISKFSEPVCKSQVVDHFNQLFTYIHCKALIMLSFLIGWPCLLVLPVPAISTLWLEIMSTDLLSITLMILMFQDHL